MTETTVVRTRLTPVQAAEHVGCSYGKLMQLVRSRQIPNIRIGNRVFFFSDSLDRWLTGIEEQSVKPLKTVK